MEQNNNVFSYTKNDSVIISGIALCMMLIHHFWGFPNWLNSDNKCLYIFVFGPFNIEYIIADSCRLCVPIFAFNTGYALFKYYEKFTFKKNIRRIMRFLFSYWVIFFIFLGFGFVLKEELPDLRHFLLNMVGLNCSPLSYVNVSFAWYVNFYILFILISPLILYLTKGSGKVIDVFAFTVWLCLMQITQLFNMTAIHILFEVGLIPLSAYFLTKYNILSILQCHIKNGVFKNMLFISAILFSRYFIRHWLLENTGHSFIGYFDCIFTPLFIICTLNLIRSANDNSIILKFLVKIGSLSMNMWFLHSVFFTGSNKLQWILYLPRYSFLIFFWGLFLTFIFAIPVSWLQRCILNRLFNISF